MWDTEIQQRLTYGDEAALAEVYDLCGQKVYAVALSVTCEPDVAEQVALDTFVSLWEQPLAFDPVQASMCGWLAVLAHRRSVKWLRDNGSVGSAAPPQRPAELAALPELTRRAVELAYYSGLTYHQIAASLDIPESTAKSRLRAGLRQLRPR
jgi:DNA-directed RNA polymerase specialized sigma24 family protein